MSESENPALDAPTPKATRPRNNRDWWPNQLDLQVLHQHSPRANPMGAEFEYAQEFAAPSEEQEEKQLGKLSPEELREYLRRMNPEDFGRFNP